MGPVRHGSVRASFAGARSYDAVSFDVLVTRQRVSLQARVSWILGYWDKTYMNESGCDDDSRSKIFRDEECPFWNTNVFMSFGEDWECSTYYCC